MKTLYIDCGMGAAGDMLTAALLELLPEPDAFIAEMNTLGIPGVHISRESAAKCGINGTHITVTVNGVEEDAQSIPAHGHSHGHGHMHTGAQHHQHSGIHEIEHRIDGLQISGTVKSNVLAVYSLIAEAESHAHGVPVTEIHFHEVGTMDAIADITAVCLLMEKLAPQQVIVSPVHVGSGHVRCAHGILPVPAPATAYILRDIPIYGGGVKGELCTPTGAALLRHFATEFGDMPVMKVGAIGYGMGKKDFEAANCVRTMLGETADKRHEQVLELHCNVDDTTAEEIGFAMERLSDAGALDVFTVPVGMKKSRPGTQITVLCREQQKEAIVKAIFKHLPTLGIREVLCGRYKLERHFTYVETCYGKIRRKVSSGYGITRAKFEYNDLARIAREQDISIADIVRKIGAK